MAKPEIELHEMQNAKIEHIVKSKTGNGLLIVTDKGWHLLTESDKLFKDSKVHWTTVWHYCLYETLFTWEEYVKYGVFDEDDENMKEWFWLGDEEDEPK